MANDKYKIRKNCVEVSVALSYICSKEIREQILVPIYLSFLKDPLSYVSDLALIALGPFIASFAAEQNEHHQTFNEVLVNNIYNFNYGKINIDFNLTNARFRDDPDYAELDYLEYKEYNEEWIRNNNNKKPITSFASSDTEQQQQQQNQEDEDLELKEEFNSFNYWREPLMKIDELLDADEKSSLTDQDKEDENLKIEAFYNDISIFNEFDDLDPILKYSCQKEDMLLSNIEKGLKSLKDCIVPRELLFYFLKNLLSNYGSNIYQADINCICAFSLPAVAFTLGEENWPCLRLAFNVLVIGLSTNIKLILASSLHELAKIIGTSNRNRDILPALFIFMRHSDEIRERILKNLSQLVNIFDKTEQKMILRRLPEFYKLENEYNWRFRVEFINQFTNLINLYDKPKQFSQIIIPMIFSLLEDKVAEVRKNTIPLLTVTIQHLYDSNKKILAANKLKETILDQIYYKLYLSKKWTFRQLFILVCDKIIANDALPFDAFKDKLMTPLLNLAKDKVNNVRLTLARVLSNEEFQKYFEQSKIGLQETIELLTKDEDKDVRSYFVADEMKEDEEEILTSSNSNKNLTMYELSFDKWSNIAKDETQNFNSNFVELLENKIYRESSLSNLETLTTNIDNLQIMNNSESSATKSFRIIPKFRRNVLDNINLSYDKLYETSDCSKYQVSEKETRALNFKMRQEEDLLEKGRLEFIKKKMLNDEQAKLRQDELILNDELINHYVSEEQFSNNQDESTIDLTINNFIKEFSASKMTLFNDLKLIKRPSELTELTKLKHDDILHDEIMNNEILNDEIGKNVILSEKEEKRRKKNNEIVTSKELNANFNVELMKDSVRLDQVSNELLNGDLNDTIADKNDCLNANNLIDQSANFSK